MNERRVLPGDCPVCAGPIDEPERIACPRCETPHHRDCYGYNHGCAIFGCNPDRPSTPVPKKLFTPVSVELGSPALPLVVRLALFSTAGLATFLLMLRLHFAERAKELTRPPQRPATIERPVKARRGVSPAPALPSDVPVGIEVGQRAPDFELEDLDGYEHSLSSHSLGHVSVLTFWRERCQDCLHAFPKGVKLSDEFQGANVWFTDVAYIGDRENTGQWVRETGIKNQVLLDSKGEVVRRYGVGTYTCFVLDPQGVIRYRGSVDGAAKAVRELLEEL